MEAGGTAAQPIEQAGITEDVIQKLQERATVLTQERKRRGRSVPEGLTPYEDIRSFVTLASHPVSNNIGLKFYKRFFCQTNHSI